jgi:hypothetical protein
MAWHSASEAAAMALCTINMFTIVIVGVEQVERKA